MIFIVLFANSIAFSFSFWFDCRLQKYTMRVAKAFALILLLSVACADDRTHKVRCSLTISCTPLVQYKDTEEVTVWLNKVGPYHNPQEVCACAAVVS